MFTVGPVDRGSSVSGPPGPAALQAPTAVTAPTESTVWRVHQARSVRRERRVPKGRLTGERKAALVADQVHGHGRAKQHLQRDVPVQHQRRHRRRPRGRDDHASRPHGVGRPRDDSPSQAPAKSKAQPPAPGPLSVDPSEAQRPRQKPCDRTRHTRGQLGDLPIEHCEPPRGRPGLSCGCGSAPRPTTQTRAPDDPYTTRRQAARHRAAPDPYLR